MDHPQIHFEVFARRAGGSGFRLELATEDRAQALSAAEEMLQGGKYIGVKVTKETRDPDTGEYKSVGILTKGQMEVPKSKAPVEDRGPPCVSPADLYNVHAREVIGRLLEGWLVRNRATPFELLHRPDLIEKLEASGVELQHAVQKIAVPEAQARGVGVHEIIRNFQELIQRAIDRVLADRKKGNFPDLAKEDFSDACRRLTGDPERSYHLGAAVASHIGAARSWSDKVGLLLDLADAAPAAGPPRALAFQVLEQALGEILGSRVGLADLLGVDLDFGGGLAALTRLAAADTVAALARVDANVARLIPPLSGSAERLARWLDDPGFENVRLAVCKRVLKELTVLKRLRPSDPRGEIDLLRALAMALTSASGRSLQLEEVRDAFVERSKMLVAADFVDAYLSSGRSTFHEALDLIWLLENVTGAANKRQAVRWLLSTVTSLKFETELTASTSPPTAHLGQLAELHRQVCRAGGDVAGVDTVLLRLGELGGRIEASAKLTTLLARASGPLVQRLGLLLKMAAGETAPLGPASDRAKAEALKLIRLPDARTALAQAPEVLAQVRGLMQSIEAAA